MDFTIDHQAGWTEVRPQGPRIDATSATSVKGAFVDLANQGRLRVILDLGSVEFIDSSGLGALINVHKTIDPRGRLVLVGVGAKTLALLKLTRLDRVFRIAASIDEARVLVAG